MVGVGRDIASRLFQREDGHPGIARPGLADRQAVQVRSGSDIRLEEVAVRAGTHLDSLTIAEARARYAGVAILALKKPGSEVSANPDHEVRLAPGDLIVALGPAEILNRMAD